MQKGNLQKMQSAVTGLMSAFVVGYQLSGWSFKAYRRSPWLTQAARGAREAASSQLLGTGILLNALIRMTTTRAVFHMVTLVLPWVMPFDIEKYLQFHYRKTRDQSLTLLELFINDGERLGLEVDNIRFLLESLEEAGEKKRFQKSFDLDR
jgi:2-dehydropantoate 2-reductase